VIVNQHTSPTRLNLGAKNNLFAHHLSGLQLQSAHPPSAFRLLAGQTFQTCSLHVWRPMTEHSVYGCSWTYRLGWVEGVSALSTKLQKDGRIGGFGMQENGDGICTLQEKGRCRSGWWFNFLGRSRFRTMAERDRGAQHKLQGKIN
jgi:hypothetical protein